jgi:hypothetical protein
LSHSAGQDNKKGQGESPGPLPFFSLNPLSNHIPSESSRQLNS